MSRATREGDLAMGTFRDGAYRTHHARVLKRLGQCPSRVPHVLTTIHSPFLTSLAPQ